MAKVTFFKVLKSNLKCAFCKKEKCPVRYYPERKIVQWYDGTRYVTACEKDVEAYKQEVLDKDLPLK